MSGIPNTSYTIDISKYQWFLDLNILHDVGIKKIIVKCGSGSNIDPRFRYHAETILRDGRFSLDVYHWPDPIERIDPQIEFLREIYRDYQPKSICIDAEQWWASWSLWKKYRNTKPHKIPHLPMSKINDLVKAEMEFAAGLTQATFYSNDNFVLEHCPPLKNWLGNYDTFVAWYPKLPKVKTWPEFFSQVEPLLSKIPLPYINGTKVLRRWQFGADQWPLPGTYDELRRPSNLDLCVDFDPVIEVGDETPIEEKQKVLFVVLMTGNLVIRSGPSMTSKSLGYALTGERHEVYSEYNGWLRIGEDRWIANNSRWVTRLSK